LPVRVLIVDDQPLFRQVARELLERRGYAVVGEAHDRASALAAVEALTPDAVLLDIRLGDDDGFEVASALGRMRPGTAVLLVSNDDHRDSAERVRLAGALGFVLKSRLAATDLARFWPAGGG
jgi:DNA-binding NarL/FixJ family response regulator